MTQAGIERFERGEEGSTQPKMGRIFKEDIYPTNKVGEGVLPYGNPDLELASKAPYIW